MQPPDAEALQPKAIRAFANERAQLIFLVMPENCRWIPTNFNFKIVIKREQTVQSTDSYMDY